MWGILACYRTRVPLCTWDVTRLVTTIGWQLKYVPEAWCQPLTRIENTDSFDPEDIQHGSMAIRHYAPLGRIQRFNEPNSPDIAWLSAMYILKSRVDPYVPSIIVLSLRIWTAWRLDMTQGWQGQTFFFQSSERAKFSNRAFCRLSEACLPYSEAKILDCVVFKFSSSC